MTKKQALKIYTALQSLGRRRLPYDEALAIARNLAAIEPIALQYRADLELAGEDAGAVKALDSAPVDVRLEPLTRIQSCTAAELVPLIGEVV